MAKSGQQQTVTTRPDSGTQNYMDEVRRRALAATGGVPDAANAGVKAMGGDPTAIASFMNPYLATMNPIFDQMREKSITSANDYATKANAFGGSRNDIIIGQALGDVGNQQAQMNYGAYGDAMQRAYQAANLGMGYGSALAGGVGPYGQTQTTQMPGQGWGMGLLGLGMSGLGVASGLGWAPFASKAAGA